MKTLTDIDGFVEVTRINGTTAIVVPKSVTVEMLADMVRVSVESPLHEFSWNRMSVSYDREDCGMNGEIIRERWISVVESLGNPVIVVITSRIGKDVFTCIARSTDE